MTLLLDTNVVVDIYSVSDLYDAVEECVAAGRDPASDPNVAYRRERHRAAVALATWLSWKKQVTECLPTEALRLLARRSPPDGRNSMKTTYTYYWVHYIRDFPLRRWQLGVVKGIDQELKGNACDDLLFRLARERGVPLITSEGVSPNGKVTKGKLYERLKTADLPVYTPAEYLASRGVSIDEEVACFHRLFRSQRNQDRFKRRYSASKSTNIRRTLRLLERDLRDTLGLA